jgi:hypothetical protein
VREVLGDMLALGHVEAVEERLRTGEDEGV